MDADLLLSAGPTPALVFRPTEPDRNPSRARPRGGAAGPRQRATACRRSSPAMRLPRRGFRNPQASSFVDFAGRSDDGPRRHVAAEVGCSAFAAQPCGALRHEALGLKRLDSGGGWVLLATNQTARGERRAAANICWLAGASGRRASNRPRRRLTAAPQRGDEAQLSSSSAKFGLAKPPRARTSRPPARRAARSTVGRMREGLQAWTLAASRCR